MESLTSILYLNKTVLTLKLTLQQKRYGLTYTRVDPRVYSLIKHGTVTT